MKTRQELEQIADFWDCTESETLQHTTIEDALSYVIDGFADPRSTVAEFEAAIREAAPFSVDCYARFQWTAELVDGYAVRVCDALCDWFDEDEYFGHPDDSLVSLLCADEKEAIKQKAAELVSEFSKHAKPWCCRVVGTVVIEADEAVQMMRAANPTWFVESENAK